MSGVCFWHGPEADQPGDFKACGECLHVWRTEAEFVRDAQAMVDEASLDVRSPLVDLAFCPLCSHDF